MDKHQSSVNIENKEQALVNQSKEQEQEKSREGTEQQPNLI
jgi:hypothetical protein